MAVKYVVRMGFVVENYIYKSFSYDLMYYNLEIPSYDPSDLKFNRSKTCKAIKTILKNNINIKYSNFT